MDLSQVNPLLELFISLMLARNKARHGSQDNATIHFRDIKSVDIRPEQIVIISKKNNPLTNNEKIRIPKEVENYNEFLALFEKIKTTVNT